MTNKEPKYTFGLLETPSDAGNSKSKTDASSTTSLPPTNSSSTGPGVESNFRTPTIPARRASGTRVSGRNESTSSFTPNTSGFGSTRIRTPRCQSASNTPYSVSSALSDNHNSSTLVAIVEGRGQARGEIGITSIDLRQPVLMLSQFSDTETYNKTLAKLQITCPLEILLPNTICECGNNSKLFSLITKQFPNVPISSVQRRYFNESKGLQYIKHLCAAEYKTIELQISSKYYCLATTAALLKYVEFIQNVIFAPNSLKAVFRGCENCTMIDSTTVKNLELLQNLKDPASPHTLYGILNYTKTAGGSRLLRSNVLQPPNDEVTIRLRQDAVMELTEKEDVFFSLQAVLSKFMDISLLDVARRTHRELVDDVDNYIRQLAVSYQLPLRPAYSSLRGFHIQMSTSAQDKGGSAGQSPAPDNLPSIFVKVTKCKGVLSFTTMDILQLNERMKTALDDIYRMANVVVTDLLANIREHIGCLYQLSDIVAMTDMLLAFAHAATLSSYVCPEFTDTLAVKQGYHPILQKISTDNVVPNDSYASEHSNFVIITGPNMGGKSTYLRQVALLQIMAQIGSFVPAQYASFRLTDQVFSRIGTDDDMESNSSTFTLEMKETNYILQNISSNSLVIIDELGRGTSAEEGVGICWAISEHLLKTKAYTFFVTHYKQLTELNRNYPNVANYFFEVQRTYNNDANYEKVSYTHVLSRGVTPETHYGLQLAELSTMPPSVIADAKQIAARIERQKQRNQNRDPKLVKQHAVFDLATRLIQVAKNSRMDEESLKVYLKSLHRNYDAEILKVNRAETSTTDSSSDIS